MKSSYFGLSLPLLSVMMVSTFVADYLWRCTCCSLICQEGFAKSRANGHCFTETHTAPGYKSRLCQGTPLHAAKKVYPVLEYEEQDTSALSP